MKRLVLLLLLSICFAKEAKSSVRDSIEAQQLIETSDSLNFIGQYGKALRLAEKALALYLKNYGKSDARLAKAYEQMGIASLRLWDLEKGIAYAAKAVEILSLLENRTIELTNHLNTIAICYYYLENYQLANIYYDKISRLLYQKLKTYNHDQFIKTLYNQGACYFQMNDFERAEELFQKALDIILENRGPDDEMIIGKYNNLGNVQLAKGNYAQAIDLFKQSLNVKLKLLPKDHHFLTTTYNNLGECYTKMGALKKAAHFYKKAIQIYEKNKETCSTYYAESVCSIGLLHQKEKNYEQAFLYYQRALESVQLCFEKAHPSMANIYSHLAVLKMELKEEQAALADFEAAFALLKFDPKKEASYKNRNTAVRILELLEKRIQLLDQMYAGANRSDELIKIVADCEVAVEIIDFLRIQYMGNEAKLHLLDTYYPLFSKAIHTCYILKEKQGKDQWLEKAFYFSEKSKSAVLLESLTKSNRPSLSAMISGPASDLE